ncbi:hypothetical protein [Tautonia marina]|uniref:hypothetical protein n=1 Tax=Tautonia marina TaxID=2653855 RepID=UPI001260D62D|nr:hypothetical protein [Tautonia marina]
MRPLGRLIGYDIRFAPSPALRALWNSKRREHYLLRPEVDFPYSVDRAVWPSRFRLGGTEPPPGLQKGEMIDLDPATVPPHYQLFDLWDDLTRMLAPHRANPEGDTGLSVGLVIPEQDPSRTATLNDEWCLAILGSPIRPPDPEPTWKCIGYDVANSGFTSAISNCGMSDDERVPLRKLWSDRLNSFGLFESVADANRYCADANQRIEGDGPFFVFELHLIWSTIPIS